MGAPKQKWTAEEEQALRAGVEKYGAGKWRAIQKDPKFAPILKSRSNVDLKDKWRNLSSTHNPERGGSRSSKVIGAGAPLRKPIVETETSPLAIDSTPFPDPYLSIPDPTPLKLPPERSPLNSRYDDYILEAIAAMQGPAGAGVNVIGNYVEEHFSVPHNFRKFLNSKLKSLTLQGKLIKVDQNYKLNPGASSKKRPESDDEKLGVKRRDTRSKRPRMDLDVAQKIVRDAEEAAAVAARAIAEAEFAAFQAEQAAREAEIAEADAESAEAAAEAMLGRASRKSMRSVPTVGGAFAVTV